MKCMTVMFTLCGTLYQKGGHLRLPLRQKVAVELEQTRWTTHRELACQETLTSLQSHNSDRQAYMTAVESILLHVLEGGASNALALLFIIIAYRCYKTSYHSKCKTKYCTTTLDGATANNPPFGLEDQESSDLDRD